MNYFELINKCLMELNYQTCRNFVDLTKNDHIKIKSILNIINSEVCSFDNWNFLLRKSDLSLPRSTGEILNTIPGRIQSLIIDNIRYTYISDFEKFMLNMQPANTYSAFNDKLLLPQFNTDKTINIVYYTNKFAKDSIDNDISSMTNETDEPVIPENFAEPILVYGACMRFKGNPDYTKFNYWYSMYKDSLATMRSKIGTATTDLPEIKLYRN